MTGLVYSCMDLSNDGFRHNMPDTHLSMAGWIMDKNVGIYIHIPFCASKCAYCDFYSLVGRDQLMPKYQNALIRQFRDAEEILSPYLIDTIYFGGGTPSYYGTKRIIQLFNALKKYGRVLLESEVTIEVNPDSISLWDLRQLRKAGVNRLSIGAQTANDKLAASLGRRHNFAQVEKTVANARRAGFDNISLDLIFGLPNQSKVDWAETLGLAAALKPEHISCYGLRIEEGTPLYLYKDFPDIPDDDDQADMYLYTVEALHDLGFHQYEISNFAVSGRESRHNLKYWNREEYFGFGPTASSYVGDLRYTYVSDLVAYIGGLERGESVIVSQDDIPKSEQAVEYLMLGLRTTRGITGQEYYRIYQSNFEPIEALLEGYARKGWAVRRGDRWRFTPAGFLLSNQLIREILDAHSEQKFVVGMPWRKNDYRGEMQQIEFS